MINTMKKKKSISPKSYLSKNVYEKVPDSIFSRKRKILETDFNIPKIEEYMLLVDLNYNCSQLKRILRYYHLKVSGNKNEQVFRLYNYLKFSYYCRKIQSLYRKYITKEYLNLKGVGLKSDPVNSTDFLTLKELKKLNIDQFYGYRDETGNIWGFNIKSIWNLIMHSKSRNEVTNPYTRKKLPIKIYKDIEKMIKLGKILNRNIITKLKEEPNNLSVKAKLKMKIVEIFQKIDDLGFITDCSWFANLSRIRLYRFVRELQDIWRYRAQLPQAQKRKILPPNGVLGINLSGHHLGNYSITLLKKKVLLIIEQLLTKGVDEDARKLGAYYVLGSLTIVNNDAAASFPWLYETFHLQANNENNGNNENNENNGN